MNIKNSYKYINIDRNNIFQDVFNIIMTTSLQQLKNRPSIKYKREEGIDEGGLLK